MLTFWIVTVLLLLLTLALLAPVLLGNRKLVDPDRDLQNIQIAHDRIAELERERDDGVMSPEEFEQAKREVESALLIDVDQREEGDGVRISGVGKGTFAALIVLLPLLSGLLYLQLGEPSLIDPQPGHSEGFDLSSEGSIEEMIRKLALRLQENPEDAEGWFLMGRTMMVLDQYRHAVTAFENTLDLVGEEPSLLLALADALAMAEGGTMAGQRTKELVERALELEPANVTALWMAGMVSEERGDYAAALRYWQRLLPLLRNEPEEAAQIEQWIERVRAKLAVSESAAAGAEDASSAPPLPSRAEDAVSDPTTAGVRVQVVVAAELAGQVAPSDTVYLLARPVDGSRVPLAAMRRRASELPLDAWLSDRDAIMGESKLSDHQQVIIVARVSRSGDATPQSGDLVGSSEAVAVGEAAGVEIVIDQLVP